MPPKRLTNFFAFTITSALQPALKLVLLPVFAGMLGPAGLGRIAYIEAIILFVAVFSALGLHHFFLRNYHHVDSATLFSTLSKFILAYNFFVLLTCFAASFIFEEREQQLSFNIAAITNFLTVFLILPQRELRIQERAVLYGATYAGVGIAQALAALGLVRLGFGVTGWFLGYLVGVAPFAFYFGLKTLPRLKPPLDRGMLVGALKLGSALSLSALGMMAISIADRIELRAFVTYDQIGLYSVGYGLGIGVSVVCSALYTTFEPSLYRIAGSGPEFSRKFARSFTISYVVVTALATAMIVLVEPLGRLLLEPRFAPAFFVTKIVAACGIYGLCHLFFTLVGIRLQARRALVIVTVAGAGLNILINLAFIPLWGISGAAYATFAAYLMMMALYALIMWHLPSLRLLYASAVLSPVLLLIAVTVTESTGWSSALLIAVGLGAITWMARAGGLFSRVHGPALQET